MQVIKVWHDLPLKEYPTLSVNSVYNCSQNNHFIKYITSAFPYFSSKTLNLCHPFSSHTGSLSAAQNGLSDRLVSRCGPSVYLSVCEPYQYYLMASLWALMRLMMIYLFFSFVILGILSNNLDKGIYSNLSSISLATHVVEVLPTLGILEMIYIYKH